MFKRNILTGIFAAVMGLFVLGVGQASAQSVTYFVSASSGLYEIREGSGTGGRFVSAPRTMYGVAVRGYTDRASRGETVVVVFDGSGRADYVAFRSDNNVLNSRANYVTLPAATFGNVWLNPNVDNVYAIIKMPGRSEVRQRLPIGTR